MKFKRNDIVKCDRDDKIILLHKQLHVMHIIYFETEVTLVSYRNYSEKVTKVPWSTTEYESWYIAVNHMFIQLTDEKLAIKLYFN